MGDAPVNVKARYVLLWSIPAALIGLVLVLVVSPGGLDGSRTPDAALALVVLTAGIEGSWFVLTALHARLGGVKLSELYPWTGFRAGRAALLGVPMIATAVVCVYVVFAPLSLVFPDAVQWWLFEDQPQLYFARDPYPLLANLGAFVSVCFVAPIAEEWIFRGLLLRRWSAKVGSIRGVVRSSLLFSLLHTDLVGGFIFAVTMAGLYARYRTLWAPTIAHIANNTLAFGMAVVVAHTGVSEPATIAEFRAQWWLPVVGVAIVLPWTIRLRKIWIPMAHWRFEPGPGPAPPPPGTGAPEVA